MGKYAENNLSRIERRKNDRKPCRATAALDRFQLNADRRGNTWRRLAENKRPENQLAIDMTKTHHARVTNTDYILFGIMYAKRAHTSTGLASNTLAKYTLDLTNNYEVTYVTMKCAVITLNITRS